MMKLVMFCSALLLLAGTADARKGILCAKKNAQAFANVVKTAKFKGSDGQLHLNTYDKFYHCGVSCLLARKCGKLGAWTAGFAKEVKDMFDNVKGNSFGSGDFAADKVGLKIKAKSDQECLDVCNAKFHK